MTRSAWARLGPAVQAALVACALALLIIVVTVPSLAVALLTRGPQPPAPLAGPGAGVSDRIMAQLAQVDGRSLFFVPAAPPPPPPPPPKDEGPRPVPKPSTYTGPVLVAMVNGTAWFGKDKGDGGASDKIISVLTIGGPEVRGVTLLGLNPPWSARVLWKGVEFDVPLLAPDTVVNKEQPAQPPASRSPSTAASDSPPIAYDGPLPSGESDQE
ncbi:MAG: hypothetical protein IT437_05220 [Phycisphaerales bacterium]|nr:hypothetical protein [Phycisphaerales bacterium]